MSMVDRLEEKRIEDECPDCYVRYDCDGERIITRCAAHLGPVRRMLTRNEPGGRRWGASGSCG
jgi:uncharacterized protein YicC (UPF0701 family)